MRKIGALGFAKGLLVKPVYRIVVFTVIFGAAGIGGLFLTRAASPTSQLEPETGTLAGAATSKLDGTASAGGYVQFGSATGMVSIPDTNYDPTGGIFVSPSGSDSGAGTILSPYKTLGKALQAVTTGGKIVLRGGVYQEGEFTITKAITIQAYPHEQAWLDGTAPTTGWVTSGSLWRLDNSPSQNLCDPTTQSCVQSSARIDPSYPMASSPQMAFVNGTALKEVGSQAAVSSSSFYYDPVAKSMYIGVNPASKTVEITTKRRAFIINISGVTVRGIGIRRYGSIENTATVAGGSYFAEAMTNSGGVNNITFENNAFTESASRGLYISPSSGVIIRGNVLSYDGMDGFHTLNPSGILFEQNTIKANNTEHFSIQAGISNNIAGALFICSTGYVSNGIIRDNIFDLNYGNGLWVSEGCSNVTIVRNVAKYNETTGIFYESCSDAIIASNLAYKNNGNGIKVIGPRNRIYNNTLVGNQQDLAVWQFLWPLGGSPYYTTANIVRNNIFYDNNGDTINALNKPAVLYDVYGDASSSAKLTPAQMIASSDYNYFYRSVAGTPTSIMRWQGNGVNNTFSTFDATLKSTTGNESNSKGPADASNPVLFLDRANENYQLDPNSAAVNAGENLPSDIATAIGVPTTSVNIGAISWPGASPAP